MTVLPEKAFCTLAMGLYGLGALFLGAGWRRNAAGARRVAAAILWIGFAVHSTALVLRWTTAAHAPVGAPYEWTLSGAWLIMGVYLGPAWCRKTTQAAGAAIVMVAFGLLLGAMLTYRDAVELPAEYQSPWLLARWAFGGIAAGCFAGATGLSALYLARDALARRFGALSIPDPVELDWGAYRYMAAGLASLVATIITGAIWTREFWGYYWNWHRLETWSVLVFLYYALLLIARSFLDWKGRRAAWLTLAGALLVTAAFFIVRQFCLGLPLPAH